MAHRVHNMDKKSYLNKMFTRITKTENKHLKPLSVYSRLEAHDQEGSHQSEMLSRPFVNFKIEVVNNYMEKRKRDDSSLNHGSPVKKIYIPNTMSPDLGCFMDYSGPLAKNDSISPSAFSYPALYEKTQVYTDKIKITRSFLQDLDQEECGCSSGKGGKVEAVECRSKSEKMLSNLSTAFDADVDDILCLSPISQEDQKEVNGQLKSDLAVEEDKGYLSTSDVNYAKEECHSDISSDPQGQEQGPTYGRCFSSREYLNATMEDPLSEHINFPLECFEGGEALNIGMPIFESSICQSDAGVKNRMHISEDPKKTNVYPDHCGLILTPVVTFPLQVKSEWVNPSEHNIITKQVPSCREEKPSAGNKNKDKTVNSAKRPRIQRPAIFNNSQEWEEQKRQYAHSVTSHMTENQGTAHGLMTELLDLMNHVDRQTGSNGPQWQHPSDLTCRNYQRTFDNETPTMTLSEWQAKNCIKHKRFCKVPKIFERSPFP